MKELFDYKERAMTEGICEEYISLWDKCKNKKNIIDMACGVKAVDYLLDSIAKGWGLDSSFIENSFDSFINGRYVSAQKGYSSEMYCRYEGKIIARTTILTLIDCNCEVYIPKNFSCTIYVSKNCNVVTRGEGKCVCVCYGNGIRINFNNRQYKRINKKERD